MTFVHQVIATRRGLDPEAAARLEEAVEACFACARACAAAEESCVAEEDVSELVTAIRLSGDCAELCGLTARLLSRGESAPGLERSLAILASGLTHHCAEELERLRPGHPPLAVPAAACRRAEAACQAYADARPVTPTAA